jgi:WD40 repeat protein
LILVSFVASLALVGMLVAQSYNARLEDANFQLEDKNTQLAGALDTVQKEKEEADRQRTRALESEAAARRFLYVTRMTQVEQARKEGNAGRVVQLLRSVIPEDAEQEDLRLWEWHHLWREYCGEKSRLRGHDGAVMAVAFSPDDRLLASGSADQTVKLWDTATGKEVRTLKGHTARVTSLSFSPDGRRLVTGSADNTVRLWDTATGKEVLSLQGHESPVRSVAFCPDGRHVASGSDDKTVRIWDTTTGLAEIVFEQHHTGVRCVAFAPDGKRIGSISGGRAGGSQALDKQVRVSGEFIVWDPFTGNSHRWEDGTWTSLAFSPDGRRAATAGFVSTVDDPTVKSGKHIIQIWNLAGGQGADPSWSDAHGDTITQIAFSPDGRQLVSSSLDESVTVWDVITGKQAFTFHEEAAALSAAFSPDGLRIASGCTDQTVKLWAPPGKGARALGLEGKINNVEFSPDGRHVVGAFGKAVVLDAISGKESLSLGDIDQYGRVTWSPDGERVAVGRHFEVWDSTTGKLAQPPLDHAGLVTSPNCGMGTAFSRDGKLLAVVFGIDSVGVWDVTTGKRLHVLRAPLEYASCAAFSPDSRRLAVGSALNDQVEPGALHVWDIATGQIAITPDGFLPGVLGVAFSPDGRRLAAAIGNYIDNRRKPALNEVRVWDAATGQLVYKLRGHSRCVFSVAFSPDGKRLASAGGRYPGGRNRNLGEVKIWDMQTGQEVCNLVQSQTVYGVAFSPDGRHLATAGKDGMKIWDGTPLAETPAYQPLPDDS